MKHISLFIFLACGFALSAQPLEPVKWSYDYEQIDVEIFDLRLTATMTEGWFVYSQHIDEGGPIPTSFHFEPGDHFELIGDTEEKSDHRKAGHDALFDMEVIKYSEKVVFIQRIRARDLTLPVKGYLEFMTCNDETCLPPAEKDFSFQFEVKGPASAQTETPGKSEPEPVSVSPKTIISNTYREPQSPLAWKAELKRAGAGVLELSMTAQIDKGWYTYSQFLEGDGPVPTGVFLDETEGAELVGAPRETGPKRIKEYDANFDMDLIKFREEVTFQRDISLEEDVTAITGFLEYMACDESKCLPPVQVPFQINAQELSVILGVESEEAAVSSPLILPEGAQPPGGDLFQIGQPDLDSPAAQCSETATVEAGAGLLRIFILGFAGGLLALLTPCVFPMIPLTVSFFTKSSETRSKGITNAALYGFFIFLVYLLLSIPFHLMEGVSPGILNDISTNIALNVAFFVIFLFFAFSFFGYYELTLPASWTNKASSAEGIGGMIGIFFMALTLALVSFSCTGPILGSLLAGAITSDGGAWQLTSGMAGFGMALALPFALFAAFPGWLNTLPRSGGWLNSVKVTLGFLELALALKFLSNADMVAHWGILKIEPFLGLWILIFAGLGLYLFGFIRFPHDSPGKKRSPVLMSLGALSFAFMLYLASGFIYDEKTDSFRSLTLLSGLAPPVGYSFVYPSDCPQNLNCYKDLNEGLAYAREQGKPVMIDFTGYACVNCRKMEEHVWPENEVLSKLKNDYVLISLYVDDKKSLPPDQQVKVANLYGSRDNTLRNYGQKWQYFQQNYFQALAQPYYVLISPDGRLLNNPVGYTPDPEEYARFLECGRDAFKKLVEEETTGIKQLGNLD